MAEEQKDLKIPSALVPRCPVCGGYMTTNLRIDDSFVQDAGWHAACARYKNFIAQNSGKRVLFLELGVGMNTPGIIKYPFIDMTYRNKKARYACINAEDNFAPLGDRRKVAVHKERPEHNLSVGVGVPLPLIVKACSRRRNSVNDGRNYLYHAGAARSSLITFPQGNS